MSDGYKLVRGDLLRIVTPGGGGWGAPIDRTAASVLGDVLDGFTSAEAAARDYGVVHSEDGEQIDEAATERARAALARPTGMLHRGRYFEAGEKV